MYVTATETKLRFNATVTEGERVPSTPDGTLQTMDVSEDHDVAAQGVFPTRAIWLDEYVPKSDPKISRLPPPSVGPFVPAFNTAPSNEKVSVSVPVRWPEVMAVKYVDSTPAATLHTSNESEIGFTFPSMIALWARSFCHDYSIDIITIYF